MNYLLYELDSDLTEGSLSIVQCWIVLNILFFTNKAYAVQSEKTFSKYKVSPQSEFFKCCYICFVIANSVSYTRKEKLCGEPPKKVLK
jgi:hypothetical protein